ncbi:ATP-binding protein [Desulfovibrio sp.]
MKTRFARMSLKNKIRFSILAGIVAVSVAVALLTRWILVSSLTGELILRGSAIAHSVAERGGAFVLDKDTPKLLSLIFDEAKLMERDRLVSYIFVTGQHGDVLAHTFTRPFPEALEGVRGLAPENGRMVNGVFLDERAVSDIAVPIKEGLYRIGTVHVGLSQDHIDRLVAKLRITFLGFISLIILLLFFISSRLSRNITRPLTRLTRISDELSRGNFDIPLDLAGQEAGWTPSSCPAYRNTDLPCWNLDETGTAERPQDPESLHTCRQCSFYRKREGDEVVQLADSFRNMVWSIKLYRRRLSESEGKYRSLFDAGPDPVFVVDLADGTIIDANPRALDLYGYPKQELIGKPFLELGPESNREFLAQFRAAGLSAGSCVYRPKMIHYRKGSQPFYVNVHACPTAYRGRTAVILAVTDVTEMMEKDAQLIQASKMKSLGEMSAGIAHELNQPLNAIKMGSEFFLLMAERDLEVSREQFAEVAREISLQVDRAAEIIQTLRSFGRKAELARETLDPNVPVRAVLGLVGRQFELDSVRFELDLADDLPPIMAQNNRLQQVFFNLVTNARDAVNERAAAEGASFRKMLRLSSRLDGNRVVIAVEDNGPGIPEDFRDKIFEPFFTTKEAGQGMGLGLAISYGIVRDYGGDIRIQARPGGGTVFCVSFPARAETRTEMHGQG